MAGSPIKKYTIRNVFLAVGIITLCITVQPLLKAYAHQSPADCNSNRFNISLIKDKTHVYEGDTITYTVTASNINSGIDLACDITDASISIILPALDGTPSGQHVILEPSIDFPAGSPVTIIGTVQYIVNVNKGVLDVVAQATASGTLHDAPVDHAANIAKTLGTTVVEPVIPGGPGEDPELPGSPQGPPTATPLSSASQRSNMLIPRLPNTGTAFVL